jgi:hypothetical protein
VTIEWDRIWLAKGDDDERKVVSEVVGSGCWLLGVTV